MPETKVQKRRVAAYARVSTDSEEQQTSYAAQVDRYTKYIQERADWEFVAVYTDEGISALNTKHRDGFNRMVADALDGKIDLIVTKSVSRFARNTVDSLTTVRKLKEKGVEVFFEKENIDVVFHCANQGGSRKTGYDVAAPDVIGNNLKMFFNMERCLKDGMKLINFGSGAQYNKARDLVKVKEDTIGTVIPKDDYGYSKYVMSEYLGVRESSNKPGIIYNPIIFGLYGQGEDYTFKFISNAIMKNLLEMPIVINQNVVFDYLYLGDFLKVMDKLIEEDVPNREFNITPTESIDLCSIVEIINEIGDFKSEVTVKNPGLNYQYTADNTRLLENMGNDFVFTSYKAGIKELYDYYKENLDRLDTEAIRKDELLKYCKTKG